MSCSCEAGKETKFYKKMDENNGDIETAERPPQLDLYEPLIGDKERAVANGNGNTNHLAMIGAKVSPIESLDYEYLAQKPPPSLSSVGCPLKMKRSFSIIIIIIIFVLSE